MSNQPLNWCEVQDFSTGIVSFARGAANAKAGWSQYIASTPFDYHALKISANENASDGGGDCWLFDVGVGAAGAEQVIIPNILLDTSRGPSVGMTTIELPILIPAGSRVAINPQDHVGASSRNIVISLVGITGGGNFPYPTAGGLYTDYGTASATTSGTLIDPGATANAWGAWTQMTAATAHDHNILALVWGFNQYTGSPTAANYQYEIGVGAAGSEQVIAYGSFSYLFNNPPPGEVFRCQIPSGSRLSMRAQASSNATAARQMTAILYGG